MNRRDFLKAACAVPVIVDFPSNLVDFTSHEESLRRQIEHVFDFPVGFDVSQTSLRMSTAEEVRWIKIRSFNPPR